MMVIFGTFNWRLNSATHIKNRGLKMRKRAKKTFAGLSVFCLPEKQIHTQIIKNRSHAKFSNVLYNMNTINTNYFQYIGNKIHLPKLVDIMQTVWLSFGKH